ncbi:MAG TPA: hypothetical protein VNQ79_12525 [Blastocatellia bacterium]|nr:hypothetical protein [Blastocatellia bacterium]
MKNQDFELNCRDFSRIVAELARERMMDVTVRADGLAHAAVCARCAARLADERALSAGLRALAAVKPEPPAQLETALLTAFRQQAAVVSEEPQTVVRLQSARRLLTSDWRWWAAAAAVLVLCALAAARMMNTSVRPGNEPIAVHPQQVAPAPEHKSAGAPERVSVKNDLRQDPRDGNHLTLVGNRKPQTRPVHRAGSAASQAVKPESDGVEEVYSDFIPLGEGLTQTPLESGHLLRVKMPRSALPRFGLPLNPERANESINAEVLMSDDGMARAIRFASQVPKGTLVRY